MNKLQEILENFPDESFLKADGFDDAIIGVEESSMRLVYSTNKIIEILKQDMNEQDAIEHYYFNIQGTYVGSQTPIFVLDL